MEILLIFLLMLLVVWAMEEARKTGEGVPQGCSVLAWLGAAAGFAVFLSIISVVVRQ